MSKHWGNGKTLSEIPYFTDRKFEFFLKILRRLQTSRYQFYNLGPQLSRSIFFSRSSLGFCTSVLQMEIIFDKNRIIFKYITKRNGFSRSKKYTRSYKLTLNQSMFNPFLRNNISWLIFPTIICAEYVEYLFSPLYGFESSFTFRVYFFSIFFYPSFQTFWLKWCSSN